MNGWASIPLRIGLGAMFAAHGLQKVFGLFGGAGIKGFSQQLSSLGFAAPMFWAYLAAYTELIGGLCLLMGFGTRIASLFLLILIIVAGSTVHLKNGFFLMNGGFEYPFVIAFACITLMILGTGKWGINSRF